MKADCLQILLHVAQNHEVDPYDIHVQHEVVICQQGALELKGIYATAVVSLFEVGNLEIRVSDSQGNTEVVDWKEGNTNVVDGREGAIAVISGGCNVNLSKSGKLVGIILTYKKRNTSNHSP